MKEGVKINNKDELVPSPYQESLMDKVSQAHGFFSGKMSNAAKEFSNKVHKGDKSVKGKTFSDWYDKNCGPKSSVKSSKDKAKKDIIDKEEPKVKTDIDSKTKALKSETDKIKDSTKDDIIEDPKDDTDDDDE